MRVKSASVAVCSGQERAHRRYRRRSLILR